MSLIGFDRDWSNRFDIEKKSEPNIDFSSLLFSSSSLSLSLSLPLSAFFRASGTRVLQSLSSSPIFSLVSITFARLIVF